MKIKVKCNVDAPIFTDKRSFSAGMCIRDERIEFIWVQKIWKNG